MININLLNWREKRRVIQNNRLIAFVIMAVLCGAILALFVGIIIKSMITHHQSNIAYLATEISAVEQKINQIQDLETQKQTLLDRRKIIESLQDARSFVVKIFDNLPRVIPAGVTLNDMTRKGDLLTLTGLSYTNTLVSDFMLELQRLKWIKDAKLTDLKTSTSDSNKKSDNPGTDNIVAFTIAITLLNPAADIPVPVSTNTKAGASPAATAPVKEH